MFSHKLYNYLCFLCFHVNLLCVWSSCVLKRRISYKCCSRNYFHPCFSRKIFPKMQRKKEMKLPFRKEKYVWLCFWSSFSNDLVIGWISLDHFETASHKCHKITVSIYATKSNFCFSFLCIFIWWVLSKKFLENNFPQVSHLYSFVLSWTSLTWEFKWAVS